MSQLNHTAWRPKSSIRMYPYMLEAGDAGAADMPGDQSVLQFSALPIGKQRRLRPPIALDQAGEAVRYSRLS